MRAVITVLQDHTAFMQRMYQCALADLESLPLSLEVVQAIQVKTMGVKKGRQWVTLGSLAETARLPGKNSRAIAIAMAEAVEGEVEAWYCIAPDEGMEWIKANHVGPLVHWGQGWWWGKLRGVHIEAEIRFYMPTKQASSRSRKSAAATLAPDKAADGGRTKDAGAGGEIPQQPGRHPETASPNHFPGADRHPLEA